MISVINEITAYIFEFCGTVFPILVIHCFYDERITLSKRKAAVFALIPMTSIIMRVFPASEIPLTPMLIAGVPTVAVIGGKMRFFHRFVNWIRYDLILSFSSFGLIIIYLTLTKIICYIFKVNAENPALINTVFILISGGTSLVMYAAYIRKNKVLMFRKQDKVFVWIYALFLFAIIIIFFDTEDTSKIFQSQNNRDIIFLFVLLFMVIFIPIFLVKSCQSSYYGSLSERQQYFLEAELNASKQYKAAQEDTRAFRHDVQNNLSVMAMLMKEGKIKEAEEYLNDMRTEVSSFSPKVVSGDEMVDSLISSKLPKMEENGITFNMDGVIDGGLDWKPMDICTVFANMIDNAIEAASKTENGFIRMEFKKSGQKRLIRAFNSCAEDVDCEKLMAGGGHITSKEDKNLHGYGISNIRRTVEKYGGMMQISCAEKIFTMDIVLMN